MDLSSIKKLSHANIRGGLSRKFTECNTVETTKADPPSSWLGYFVFSETQILSQK